MGKLFKKILIANRGEIALRVIRTCREMDIVPVTVYSEADKKALHVILAEEAYYIGEAKPSESYLNIEKIIEVAKKSKVQALHPGYGFLAENSELVKKCEQEGIVFIGPPSEPMEIMGNKTASRRRMNEAGVQIIPGTLESIKNEKDFVEQSQKNRLSCSSQSFSRRRGKRVEACEKGKRPSFFLSAGSI